MYQAQIKRIKQKLKKARRADRDRKVFGAASHQYELGLVVSAEQITAFEQQYDVTLPSCYRAFIMQVGDGGSSYEQSGAGPYYGIYPFGQSRNLTDFVDHPQVQFKNTPAIVPGLTKSQWEQWVAKANSNEPMLDEEYDAVLNFLFGGLMPLGSQGCTYYHALILNGPHAGRVVNVDYDLSMPIVCFEANFLDWYERWLDEILDGTLLQRGSTWFGHSMGGDAAHLLGVYDSADDEQIKYDALFGLYKLASADRVSQHRLLTIAQTETGRLRDTAVQTLTKFAAPLAIDSLRNMIAADDAQCKTACQAIRWYARDVAAQFNTQLLERLATITEPETFRFAVYILKAGSADYAVHLMPFCNHELERIRQTAYYELGCLANKSDYVAQFILGLQDPAPNIVRTVLQALRKMTDPALLPAYQAVNKRFSVDESYIWVNLNHRLREFGYDGRDDFAARYIER